MILINFFSTAPRDVGRKGPLTNRKKDKRLLRRQVKKVSCEQTVKRMESIQNADRETVKQIGR